MISRGSYVTVAQLIVELSKYPGDTRVCVDSAEMGYLGVVDVWEQASDVVPCPLGTDPMCEGTVAVVCLGVAEADR